MKRVVPLAGADRANDRWAMRVFAVAMLGVLGLAWWLVRANRPHGEQVVLRLDRSGALVSDDEQLARDLSGDVVVDQDVAATAFCVNGPYWMSDVTLDLEVVVATSSRLYRVAELVASGRWPRALATRVETDLLAAAPSVSVEDVDDVVIREFGRQRVEAYLADAAVAPSRDVADNFVVYAVSTTVWDQSIYVIDRRHIDRGAVERFAGEDPFGGRPYEVRVSGQSARFAVDRQTCA